MADITNTDLAATLLGFQNKGANWKDKELYYFTRPTGIRYEASVNHANMFHVVWPDGTLSADFYNLVRAKQHCRDLARAIYPRHPPAPSARPDDHVARASDCDVAEALGEAAHSTGLAEADANPATEAVTYEAPKAPRYMPPVGGVETLSFIEPLPPPNSVGKHASRKAAR